MFALVLAVFATATSGDLPRSPYTDIAVATIDVAGLMLFGWVARWSGLWMFSVAFIGASLIHQEFFWQDNPTASGTDDLGPSILVLALPVALGLIAMGTLARDLRDRFSTDARQSSDAVPKR
jgi:hypothetical protein